MCGVFGVFNIPSAALACVKGLHAQQHRAIEYAGIVSFDAYREFHRHTGSGTVSSIFVNEDIMAKLPGHMAIGHIRYSTVQDLAGLDNTQPILGQDNNGLFALAHNGNLTNVNALRKLVPGPLLTSMDTELIMRLYCLAKGKTIVQRIQNMAQYLRGSYSLLFLFQDRIVAVRDRSGNRPLSLAKKDRGYVVASETCAFSPIEAEFVRDIEPGEIVQISDDGIFQDWLPDSPQSVAQCIFEPIYYAHPSSNVFSLSVSEFRKKLGRKLESICPAPTDIVVPVPDSAHFIAQGYAQSRRSGEFAIGITRSHYVGRTFIANGQSEREARVRGKFQVIAAEVEGKSIALIDDSIVRLTTLPVLMKLLRYAKAREIHVRIACPMIISPCKYGIDTPTKNELAAAVMNLEQMRKEIGADSLQFLPLEALQEITPQSDKFCYACMTGDYPLLE